MFNFGKNNHVKEAAKKEYQKALENFLVDRKLDDSEKKELADLAIELKLTKAEISAARKEVFDPMLNDLLVRTKQICAEIDKDGDETRKQLDEIGIRRGRKAKLLDKFKKAASSMSKKLQIIKK